MCCAHACDCSWILSSIEAQRTGERKQSIRIIIDHPPPSSKFISRNDGKHFLNKSLIVTWKSFEMHHLSNSLWHWLTNNFSIVSAEISDQTFCMPFFKSSKLLIDNFSNLSSSIDHTFSIMFKSGLFADHLSCFMLFFLKKSCVIFDTYGRALNLVDRRCHLTDCLKIFLKQLVNVLQVNRYILGSSGVHRKQLGGPEPWHVINDQTPRSSSSMSSFLWLFQNEFAQSENVENIFCSFD